jgi:hypothetical protein
VKPRFPYRPDPSDDPHRGAHDRDRCGDPRADRDGDESGEDAGGEPCGDEASSRHQPANAHELALHPPATPECLRVRQWLRDYADGELEPEGRRRVDEHVHACADCDLALSRAEREAILLQRAYEGVPRQQAPAGLVDAVLERVRRVAAQAYVGGTSANFTPRVMERVRMEWPAGGRRQPRWLKNGRRWLARVLVPRSGDAWMRRHGRVLAPMFVLLVAIAVSVTWRWQGGAGGPRILEARDAVLVAGGDVPAPLRSGGEVPFGSVVRTGAGGSLRLALPGDPDAPGGVAAELTLHQDSEVQLLPDSCELRAGEVDVVAAVTLLAQTDASGAEPPARIRMGAGRYRFVTERIDRLDRSLTPWPVRRVRLEVQEGQAEIARGPLAAVVVGAGRSAQFDPWSRLEVEPLADEALLARIASAAKGREATGAPAPDLARATSWSGRVLDADGRGVTGATVRVTTSLGRQPDRRSLANGEFALDGSAAVEGTLALVHVTLPAALAATHGAAGMGPVPVRFVPAATRSTTDSVVHELAPLRLPRERRVAGHAADADGRAVAGAMVVPCVFDELVRAPWFAGDVACPREPGAGPRARCATGVHVVRARGARPRRGGRAAGAGVRAAPRRDVPGPGARPDGRGAAGAARLPARCGLPPAQPAQRRERRGHVGRRRRGPVLGDGWDRTP